MTTRPRNGGTAVGERGQVVVLRELNTKRGIFSAVIDTRREDPSLWW
ncbi:MAG TPA: hypothetical protein VHG35_02800 [Gemmatimonadales bacterium]|nr:hypothetical protein [Gemmatimonadales bacterium]